MISEEKALLSLIKKGDRFSFDVIYKAYAGFVLSTAYKILKDKTAADDILQETFAAVWKNRKTIDVEVSFANFLLQTVKKLCMKNDNHSNNSVSLSPEVQKSTDNKNGQTDMENKDLLSTVIDAINRVCPPACRQILWMHVMEDRSYKEIAEKLGIKVEVVRNQICKARKELRVYLGRG